MTVSGVIFSLMPSMHLLKFKSAPSFMVGSIDFPATFTGYAQAMFLRGDFSPDKKGIVWPGKRRFISPRIRTRVATRTIAERKIFLITNLRLIDF